MATPKTILRRIDRIRFDLPLAALLGVSGAFAVFAMPEDVFGLFPGAPLVPFGQALLAALAALVLGAGAFVAMKLAAAVPPAIWEPDLDTAARREAEEGDMAERIRTRRADRHPDAPVREPIRASRDLGRPFMDVGTPAAEPREADEARDEAEAVHAPFAPWYAAEGPEIAPAADEPAAADPCFAPEWDEGDSDSEERAGADPWLVASADPVSDRDDRQSQEETASAPESAAHADPAEPFDAFDEQIAAFSPAEEPAPPPARGGRQSISALMDRLSAGVERRGGRAPSDFSTERLAQIYGRPRAAASDLRAALDELNRLAARRG